MIYKIGDYCKVKIYEEYLEVSRFKREKIYKVVNIITKKKQKTLKLYQRVITLYLIKDITTQQEEEILPNRLYGNSEKFKKEVRKEKLKRLI